MINDIRNTVLAIVNKNNYGYITPADFNLYAEQAQLSIFEDYFQSYNNQIIKENARASGTGYANLRQITEEVIDTFSTSAAVSKVGNFYAVPNDCYLLMNVLFGSRIIEKVPMNLIAMLNASNLTAPSTDFPVYVGSGVISAGALGATIAVYPSSIASNLTMEYIRYPRVPKWTWIQLGANNDPVFNSSANDYVDFELPETDAPLLISKILQYAGVSIREADVYKLGATDEATEYQKDRS
jgi:hypothetical protein